MKKPRAKNHQDSSVIIPAYAAADTIGRTMDSICAQTVIPAEVLVGVDADPETMGAVLAIAAKCDKTKVRPFWFPHRSWPYFIRNTLAVYASRTMLHFFDADDVMYPQHCEIMAEPLKRGRYMTGLGEMKQGDADPVPWDRGCGVVSILRSEFIRLCGFEPWKCAADTEAQVRWVAAGMLKCRPKNPTMLVHKHPGSLTTSAGTGYGSDLRERYKGEIRARIKSPEQRSSLAVVECEETGRNTEWKPSAPVGPPPVCIEYDELQEKDVPGFMMVDATELAHARWLLDMVRQIGSKAPLTKVTRKLWATVDEWLRVHESWRHIQGT